MEKVHGCHQIPKRVADPKRGVHRSLCVRELGFSGAGVQMGPALNGPLLGGNLRELATLFQHLCGKQGKDQDLSPGSSPGPGEPNLFPVSGKNSRLLSLQTKMVNSYFP